MSDKKVLVPYYEGRMVKIKYEGGGQLPEELSGMYTSVGEANKAISNYTPKRTPKKVTKNAKSTG